MKNTFRFIFVLLMAAGSSHADVVGGSEAGPTALPPVESMYAAYGPGIVTRWQPDPDRTGHGRTTIQMQENIGQENETPVFTAAFSPVTAIPELLNAGESGAANSVQQTSAPWTPEIGTAYFVCISHRTNGYFLSSIDGIDQWQEEMERKTYLASGQFQRDRARADVLAEEIDRIGSELARVQTELEPLNLPEAEYLARIAPLEQRNRELRAELEKIWSHFRNIPLDAAVFQDAEPQPNGLDK